MALEFRRFEEHNAVDRNRYLRRSMDELRSAMYVKNLCDSLSNLIQRNGTVHETDRIGPHICQSRPGTALRCFTRDLQQGDDVPGNVTYAITWRRNRRCETPWTRRVAADVRFLTKNSPGLRTSPVKRGYWVFADCLESGFQRRHPIYRELPKDEAHFASGLSQRCWPSTERTRTCAVCHVRFDSVGLIFESYGQLATGVIWIWRQSGRDRSRLSRWNAGAHAG